MQTEADCLSCFNLSSMEIGAVSAIVYKLEWIVYEVEYIITREPLGRE